MFIAAAQETSSETHGLDRYSGFNILAHHIFDVMVKPFDLIPQHPPYHDIVIHSRNIWARVGHPDYPSRCANENEFVEKFTIALKNQRRFLRIPHGPMDRRNSRYAAGGE